MRDDDVRLGKLLVDRGFLTPPEMKHLTSVYAEDIEAGRGIPLDEFIVRTGCISRSEMDALLKELKGGMKKARPPHDERREQLQPRKRRPAAPVEEEDEPDPTFPLWAGLLVAAIALAIVIVAAIALRKPSPVDRAVPSPEAGSVPRAEDQNRR